MPKLPYLLAAPTIFGWQHIVYLVVFLVISAGSLTFIQLKVKSEKTVDIIVKCLGGLLLATIVWNRITQIFHDGTVWALIPNTYCGTTSLLFSICILACKRDHLVFHYFIYAAFWGGLISSIYPTYIGQADYFMYQPTISGMLHHSIGLYISVLMLMTGYVKPRLKRYYAYPVGFCFLMCYGVFLLDCFGDYITEAMYIFQPLVEGTILTWYFVGALLIFGNLGLLALWEKVLHPYLLKKKTAKSYAE